jgi:hypothetical protein
MEMPIPISVIQLVASIANPIASGNTTTAAPLYRSEAKKLISGHANMDKAKTMTHINMANNLSTQL